jgi:hypothetical protein
MVKSSSKSGVAAILDNIRSKTEPKSSLSPLKASLSGAACASKRLVRGRCGNNFGASFTADVVRLTGVEALCTRRTGTVDLVPLLTDVFV